jgi:hypothetical protein
MSGKISLLVVAILAFCGLSAAVDTELRRKRRVLHIDSVDEGLNSHALPSLGSDLWGRHLGAGSSDGDKTKGGKSMMMGMKMDSKKNGGMMGKGSKGGKSSKGAMGGMMTKKKNADYDGFWGGDDFSMSLPAPTSFPTKDGAFVPVPSMAPVTFPVPTPATFSPVAAPAPATASPTSVIVLPTRAPVGLTASPFGAPTDTPTLSPFTVCNALPRGAAFLRILTEITALPLLTNPATPQGFAYRFLVSQDPAAVDPCTYATVEQRYAAIVLFRSTNGQGWTNPTGWLSAGNECNWFGVRCDGNGLVTGLLLCK